MPFIHLDIHVARQLLEPDGEALLSKLLRDGVVNPKEFDILRSLQKVAASSGTEREEAANKLREFCESYFDKDVSRAYELLVKFADKKMNVSWVLFSRNWQFVKFEELDPLEGYIPRKNDVLKTIARVQIAPKGGTQSG